MDEINKAGGVSARSFSCHEDNKSNPTEAVSTVESCPEGKVPALIELELDPTLAVSCSKLEEYQVPMIVETSLLRQDHDVGQSLIFRISPTSAMEAKSFQPLVAKIGIKKADFYTNNPDGIGSADEYSKMLKANGVTVGVMETMDPKATRFSAVSVRSRIGADTLFMTTAVEQLTIIPQTGQGATAQGS